MFYKLCDPSFVVKLVCLLRRLAFILDENANAFIEKRFFAQAFGELVEAVFSDLKNIRVRFECRLRSALIGCSGFFERFNWNASFVFLLMRFAVTPDLEL